MTGNPVAVVTGAGTGIGHEIARELAGHGYDLTLVGRRAEKLADTATMCQALGAQATVVSEDIGQSGAAQRIVDHTISIFGRIDAVVNDAGTATMGPFAEMADAAFAAMFNVNVIGPILLIKAAVPHLALSPHGSVVNVTSGAGINSSPRAVGYGASKAALNHATRSLARELGPTIRVNAVVPGTCRTEIWDSTGLSPEAIENRLTELGAMVPAGRVGEPGEVARWVWAFIDPASAWVTGSILSVDGGFTA